MTTEIPAVDTNSIDVSLDDERQEDAREYARIRRYLLLLNLTVTAVLVVGALVTGLSSWLKETLIAAGLTSQWLLVAGYFAAALLAYTLVMVPLSWYSGYVLPHRYGLSTQTPADWFKDQAKSLALTLVIGLLVGEVMYWLLRNQTDIWWIWAAAFLILFTIVLGHLAPVLIVPLFYTLTPLDDEELVERIKKLADRTDVTIADIYTIDLSSKTTAANAMVMGLGSTKRIALGDTLYEEYSHDEIETIIAHELGHQVHHDLELGIVVQSVLLLAGMYVAHLFLTWGVGAFGLDGIGDIAAFPLLVLAIGIFSLITMPLNNAYSRWRERLADRYALQTTEMPRAFANAMTRLANQNLADVDPPRWVVWLLYSHPPIKERLAAAGVERT